MENIDIKKVFGFDYKLSGTRTKKGDKLKDCRLYTDLFEEKMLSVIAEGPKFIAVYPSVDVAGCHDSIKRMDVESYIMSDTVPVIAITSDNPFNLHRFSFDKDIEHVKLFSDYNGSEFGKKNGFLLKDVDMLVPAIIVTDSANTVKYVEYAENLAHDFNYNEAVKVLKELMQSPF